MSTDATTKRQRADEAAEQAPDPQTLQGAWEIMRSTGPRLFKSLDAYLKAMVTSKEDITQVLAAIYFKSAGNENRFYVPTELQALEIVRDKRGVITQIADSTKHGIAGAKLARVLVYAAMREKGMATVIMRERDDGTVEVLAIPGGVQITKTTLSGEGECPNGARTMYTHKLGFTVNASAKQILDLLSLSYVDIPDVSSLVRSLNALAGKEDLNDIEKFVDFAELSKGLQDQETKQSKKHFLQTLMAANISSMSMDQRIEHFIKEPSYTLANNLGLRLPHHGPVYSSLHNKVAGKVRLGDVGAEEAVLLSSNHMSHRDYKGVLGDVANLGVYVNADTVGGRKNGKWAKMSDKHLGTAGSLIKYLSAISGANGTVKTASGVLAADQKEEEYKEIELD